MRNAELVDAAVDLLTSNYVFPDKAAAIAEHVQGRLVQGAYDELSGAALCQAVTADLRAVHPDRHLSLVWYDEPQPEPDPAEEAAAVAGWRENFRLHNQGLHRVERLAGNVGLIDLRTVADADDAGARYAAAMQLVADTYALLVDLRHNGGGWPDGAALFCSYFFGPEPVHLNDIYDGRTGRTRQYWSLAHLAGPRYLDRPVYVLTSAKTFSGGEDIAYTLQAHGRATVIGETTGGGAQPFDTFRITPHAAVQVPIARTVNPITGTNWEAVGVKPDVAVSADQAFTTGYQRALRDVLAATADPASDPVRDIRAEAEKALADQADVAEDRR